MTSPVLQIHKSTNRSSGSTNSDSGGGGVPAFLTRLLVPSLDSAEGPREQAILERGR